MLFAAAAEAASNGEEQTQTSPENGPQIEEAALHAKYEQLRKVLGDKQFRTQFGDKKFQEQFGDGSGK